MVDARTIGCRCITALLVLLLIAGTAARPAAAADPYEINVILSLTGPGSFLGKNEQTAMTVVEQNVNRAGGIDGRPVHFAIADDQSSPQVDVQLASALIAKSVPLILGPSLTAGCGAITALLKVDGPLLYCLTAGAHPAKGGFAFTYGVSTRDLIAVNIRYFHDRGWKKIGLITSTDASGQDGEAGLDEALKRPEFVDMTVAAREHYAVSDQFMSAGLPAVALDSVPAGPLHVAVRDYNDSLKAVGVHADVAQAIGWDPAIIIVGALKKRGLTATAGQLRDYLAGLHGFAGANGVYDFRDGSQRGLTEANGIMVRWDTGKDTWVAISKFGGVPLK